MSCSQRLDQYARQSEQRNPDRRHPGANDIVLRSNFTYREAASGFSPYKVAAEIGYTDGSSANGDVVLENNYFIGGFYINRWSSGNVRGNLVYDYAGPMVLTDSSCEWSDLVDNRFYGVSTLSTWQHAPDAPAAFTTWRAQTGLTGPRQLSGAVPHPTWWVVRPNQYEAGRANIVGLQLGAARHAQRGPLHGAQRGGSLRRAERPRLRWDPRGQRDLPRGAVFNSPWPASRPPAVHRESFHTAPTTGPTFNVFVVMRRPVKSDASLITPR